jgi:hypothetical protein
MKRRIISHLAFWILVVLFLTFYFGRYSDEYDKAFYFASFLLPVVVGTSYFFSGYLIPKFLLTGRYKLFALYLLYMIIISLYLEMLVVTVSFVILANYQYNKMLPITVDAISMGITLYLIVFGVAFIRMIQVFRRDAEEKNQMRNAIERNQLETITVVVDRKKNPLSISQILYIESLADYVKIITVNGSLVTKEKISSLGDRLPTHFIRIHRSFIVNKEHVQSFNKEKVRVGEVELPISRSYRKSMESMLVANTKNK